MCFVVTFVVAVFRIAFVVVFSVFPGELSGHKMVATSTMGSERSE